MVKDHHTHFHNTNLIVCLTLCLPLIVRSYKYDWKVEEAQKNLLRTHTTAVSARMLYKLGQEETFHPVKYFSIDRVFRNETLDATHLAEFHQIEGVVADYDLTLGDLMGMLNEFFQKMGKDRQFPAPVLYNMVGGDGEMRPGRGKLETESFVEIVEEGKWGC